MAFLRKNNPSKRMTRGRAIIEVRMRLGGEASITTQHNDAGTVYHVLDGHGYVAAESGDSWEDCLSQLDHPTPEEAPADATPA